MAPKKRRSSEVSPNREAQVRLKPTTRVDPNRRITRSLTISSTPTAATAPKRSSSSSKRKGKKPVRAPPKQPRQQQAPPAKDDDDDEEEEEEQKEEEEEEEEEKEEDKEDDDGGNAGGSGGGAAAGGSGSGGGGSSSSKPTIIIEHCKQCTSFKNRANEAKAGLEHHVPGINVLINPEKPRKGCFEIRAEDGKAYVSLLDLKRPFQPMKDLDMDEVVANIAKEIRGD